MKHWFFVCCCLLVTSVFYLLLPSDSAHAQTDGTQSASKRDHISPATLQFYSWFANVTLTLFKKGDYDSAAWVARIMENSWDRDGDRYQDDVWNKIDTASDAFVQPIEHSDPSMFADPSKAIIADKAAVENAYTVYLATLKSANSPSSP